MITATFYGGTGNCMFISAAVISYAKKWGMDYYLPTKVTNPHHKENSSPHFFKNINYSDRQLSLPIYKEKDFTYEEIPYFKHVTLQGYFQSHLYFNDYREDIIKAFGFDDIETKKDICSIHIRRGDYTTLQKFHPPITETYIGGAILCMAEHGISKFKIFSDDLQWCRNHFENNRMYRNFEFEFSEGKSDIEDLRDMASCENSILANSSFSWWGHYLNPNPNKQAICPSRWFGESLNHDTKDLMMPHFKII